MLLDETNMTASAETLFEEGAQAHEQSAEIIRHGEMRTFGLPSWIWTAMLACYAIFFAALLAATGNEGGALMMIVISVLYTAMYFGTAGILSNLGNAINSNHQSQWKDGRLQTIYGGLDMSSVASQILIVPAMLAFFGTAIAIIVAIVT